MKKKPYAQILVLLIILAGAYALNRIGFFEKTLDFIESLKPYDGLAFIAIFALSCIFFFPSFIFSFASGILFGVPKGVCLGLLGLGLGSLGAFLIGRYLARDWLTEKFQDNQKFHALDDAISKRGWKIIALARLSPIFPFMIGNYLLGTSKISAGAYFFASIIGSIPSITLYSYLGFLTGDMAGLDLANRSRTPMEWVLIVVGLLVTIFLSWYLKKVAQKALESH